MAGYDPITKKIYNYNKQLDIIKDKGYMAKTETYKFLSAYSEFITPNGSNRGKILKYGEAKARLQNLGYNVSDFTKEYYNESVKSLLGELDKYNTANKFEKSVRDDLVNKTSSLIEYLDNNGIDFGYSLEDIENIPTKDLYDLFKEASELKTKTKPSDNSFYIELERLIDNYLSLNSEE